MNHLESKTAIVNGRAVGIDRALRDLAEKGAKVAILDKLETDRQPLAAKVTVKGHDAAFWPMDVSDEAAAWAADPVGITGEPDNVAWAVVWLASDKAKFVARAAIVIDDDGDTAR